MTEGAPNSRWRRLGKFLVITTLAGLLLLAGLVWYTTTDSFRTMVRRRVVAELERITGGRAELGSFHVVPFQFRVEVRDLTIHGLEKPGEAPYVHVDRLIARVKLISVLGAEVGFNSVVVDHPTIHIIVYPDGSTNQPKPKLATASRANPVERLFALSISRLEVRHGRLLWNDQEVPLDFVAGDMSADMNYSFLRGYYETNLLLGKVDTRFDGYRSFAWTAEAHLNLSSNGVEVKSFKATSGRSRVEGSGRLKDFRRLGVEATYDATLDLAEVAAIARQTQFKRGMLQASGRGAWSPQDFATAGKLVLKELDWRDEKLALHNASFSAQFGVNRQRLVLTQIQGKLLGGSVSGEVEVTDWWNSRAKLASDKPKAVRKGNARLRYRDLSVGEIAQLFSSPSVPLHRMNLSGGASGNLEARWSGTPRNLDADIVLDVTAPERVSAGQIPLNAHGIAKYRASQEELEVAEFSAHTRATEIHASGLLSDRASMKIAVNTTDLSEWTPLLAAMGVPAKLPVTLRGRASFNGTATGRISDVTLAGSLHAENFDSLIPATSHTPERLVQWGLLSAAVQLSSRNLAVRNGILRHGATEISFDLTAGLVRGHFTPQSRFTARLETRKTDLSAILAVAGYDLPVSGTVDLQLRAEGTRADPSGDGRIQLTNAMIYGQPVQHFTADLRLLTGEVQLNNISAAYFDARVGGAVAYHLSTGASKFNLEGTNFDLARIPQVQASRFKVEGRLDFTAQGSGTLRQPAINATVRLRGLTLDDELAGDFTLDAVTQGEQLHLTGRSQFEQAELQLDGDVHMREGWTSTLNFHFNRLDVDSFLRAYLQGRITGHSVIAGDLQVRGPLRRPRELTVSGNLTDLALNVEGIELHNDGPVRFAFSNQLLRLEPFHLTGEQTDLTGSGTVHLAGERELDLRAQGRLNLRLIESFNRDFSSSGMVTLDMTVAGTIARPTAQGKLQISNGSLSYIDLPSGLSEMNGSLSFNRDRVQIESLTARSGGGTVTLGGYATLHDRRLAFDLTIHGQDVRLRYPPGISSTADADLRFAGTADSSTLSGDITVKKLSMTPGFDFGAYLARSAQGTTLPQTNPLLNRIRLDVHIVTTPELQMQTAAVRLSGDADLRLRGSAAKPALLGRADITEGDVYFNGTKYHMERGDVNFVSPVRIEPIVDLQMTTRVRDYDITVSLNGEPNKLSVNYRSEPPLPAADIVALLALGRTREESARLQQSGQSALSQEASNAILSEALNTAVSNRVQRLFGGSRIKIDPQGLATETSPARGPQVTIEQQVTNELTLTYSTNVSQASQQIIQLEYNVSRNVSIVAVRDQNGVVSFDVRIRQRKK